MTEATPHPVLSIRNLKISFLREGKFNAIVRDLNLDIHAGETLAIVGESGSGKSVSALSVMQLLPENSSKIEGSIKLNGEELIGTSPRPDADDPRQPDRDDLSGADDEPQPGADGR